MLARVKATGEIVEVYERYDDLAMESTYTELARIYRPGELDLDITAEPVNPQSALNQEECAVFHRHLHEAPLEFLSPDEQTKLQEIANELSCLCRRLCTIDMEWCKREVKSRQLSLHNASGDSTAPQAGAAMEAQSRDSGIPSQAPGQGAGCVQGNPGRPGMSGTGPLWNVSQSLQTAISQIETLLHTGSPQTMRDPQSFPPAGHGLSGYGDTHAQTHIHSDHNSFLRLREI